MARKNSMNWRKRILVCVMMLSSVAALPTTIVFFVGMLPTIVSRFTDRSRGKTRVLTVGFMNFAACFPFWYQLMHKGHNFPNAVELISQPSTIVIMYAGALMGYLIEWGLAGIVANVMVGRGWKRLEALKDAQNELIQRWGPEVAGDMPLDIDGFPLDTSKH